MEPEEIKIEFFKRRHQVMMKDVAAKVGVTPAAVTRVIDRHFKSLRIAQAVSAALDRPLDEVFPEMVELAEARRSACS